MEQRQRNSAPGVERRVDQSRPGFGFAHAHGTCPHSFHTEKYVLSIAPTNVKQFEALARNTPGGIAPSVIEISTI